MHKRKAGPGHRIPKERGRGCRRQAMLAAQMQESAHAISAARGPSLRRLGGPHQDRSDRSWNTQALAPAAARQLIDGVSSQ